MNTPVIPLLALFSLNLTLLTSCATHQSNTTKIDVHDLIKSTKSWNGKSLPGYPKGQPEVTIKKFTIPAGVRLDSHLHPYINAGVLLSGQLTVRTLEGKTLHLKAGDPIIELINTWHYGLNEGKEPAVIVVVYAGIKGKEVTLEKTK